MILVHEPKLFSIKKIMSKVIKKQTNIVYKSRMWYCYLLFNINYYYLLVPIYYQLFTQCKVSRKILTPFTAFLHVIKITSFFFFFYEGKEKRRKADKYGRNRK